MIPRVIYRRVDLESDDEQWFVPTLRGTKTTLGIIIAPMNRVASVATAIRFTPEELADGWELYDVDFDFFEPTPGGKSS